MIIAIDGPSGAGKSTLASQIASEFGFLHIDTGAMYRAVGIYIADRCIDVADAEKVEEALKGLKVDIRFLNGMQLIYLNGHDVTMRIRQPEVSMLASNVSKIPAVRNFLVDQQRLMAAENNIIMDGRDIGTVVFPDADLKIYLTASPKDRAERRYLEQIEKGFDVKLEEVMADVQRRDSQDMNRSVAPLKPAEDAVIVDTTGKKFEESFAILTELIREKMKLQ